MQREKTSTKCHLTRKECVSLSNKAAVYSIPMVSFCDIPLSEIKEHISKYGSYGLGMTKEWGIRKGLNPVLYVSQNSMLSESYRKAIVHFAKDNNWTDELKALLDVARYLKNYEADLTRGGTTVKNYRFSDEREWRYVPPYTEKCDMLVTNKGLTEPELKAVSDAKLVDLRLEFEPNDIKNDIKSVVSG